MPVLRINATENGLQMHGSDTPVHHVLADHYRDDHPVVIMVHGYKYAPSDPAHCPHEKIFSDCDQGWPKSLGYSKDARDKGLCIAFGWYARGPLWHAHRRAAQLGTELAALISQLRQIAPNRPVNVIAHSLGSEIALSALMHLRANSINRMVLLTGASFDSKARHMLSTPAGLTTELFNVTSRENDLFDLAFEHLIAAPQLKDRAIGQGIDAPNAVNLQLDCDQTLNALERLGLPIARSQRRICHWSAYTRPGVMTLYAQLLRDCDTLTQSHLARFLPSVTAPRWSRLVSPVRARGHHLVQSISLPITPLALKLKNRIMSATSTQGKDNEHAY